MHLWAGIAAFFRDEGHRLTGYLRKQFRNLSEMDIEDIVGDVVVSAFEKMDGGVPIGNLSAYIYKSALNKGKDLHRERQKHETDAEVPEVPDGSGEVRFDGGTLFRAVSKLPEKYRSVWMSVEIDEIPYAELSKRLGEPVGTLLSRKHRAERMLAVLLAEESE